MKIKVLIMDVDGTLTDGRIYISEQGECCKAFNVKDGYAINEILPKYNITPVIITGRSSEIVRRRSEELHIKYLFQGVRNKAECMYTFLRGHSFTADEVAYIGDDLNDIECMGQCAVTGCPADACEEVKKMVSFISSKQGGEGAVREFIEWVVK